MIIIILFSDSLDGLEVISRYGDYLRAGFSTSPVAKSDRFPPTLSKVFIKLALVKKKKTFRAQADEFNYITLQGDIDQILQGKESIELNDILKPHENVRLVVVEGVPGIGKSTLAMSTVAQTGITEEILTSSAPQITRGKSAVSQRHQ